MATDLSAIPCRRLDFRTDQSTDWLDGLPIIGVPVFAGAAPGTANVGVATVQVSDVDVGARIGVVLLAVTAVAAGVARIVATDLGGTIVGAGVAGLPMMAGGVALTLAQVAGQPPLAIGDAFAVSLMPAPQDLASLSFALAARQSTRSSTIVLSATSAPADGGTPTILTGGAAGTLAMRMPRSMMSGCAPGDYPYALVATDASGRTVPVFLGTIRHRSLPTLQD